MKEGTEEPDEEDSDSNRDLPLFDHRPGNGRYRTLEDRVLGRPYSDFEARGDSAPSSSSPTCPLTSTERWPKENPATGQQEHGEHEECDEEGAYGDHGLPSNLFFNFLSVRIRSMRGSASPLTFSRASLASVTSFFDAPISCTNSL